MPRPTKDEYVFQYVSAYNFSEPNGAAYRCTDHPDSQQPSRYVLIVNSSETKFDDWQPKFQRCTYKRSTGLWSSCTEYTSYCFERN